MCNFIDQIFVDLQVCGVDGIWIQVLCGKQFQYIFGVVNVDGIYFGNDIICDDINELV